MAYKLEDVHKEFIEAISLHDQAVESFNSSLVQLRQAKSRLHSALESLTEIMGEWEEGWGYHEETGDIFAGGSLLTKLNKGLGSLDDFFGLGSLF